MQKKLNRKLVLTKETLRSLSPRELYDVKGEGGTSASLTSNPTWTCDTCECYTMRSNCCGEP